MNNRFLYSVANNRLWDQTKLRAFILYHTIPTFNNLKKMESFENIVRRGENAGNQHFLPFLTMFSTLPTTKCNVLVTFILWSANTSNLDQSEILLYDKELTHYHTMLHFDVLKIYSCGKHREKRRNCL